MTTNMKLIELQPVVFHLLKYYSCYDNETLEKLYRESDLRMMFYSIRKGDLIQAYKDIFSYLPKEIKYETFFDVYTQSEYNFNKLTIDILEGIKKLRPSSVSEELHKFADDKGFITIYRGECTKSAPIKKALSWTLNKDRALWFSRRFLFDDNIGYIHSAKVKPDNIIGFYNGREEEEIVVRHKYLKHISTEEVYSRTII